MKKIKYFIFVIVLLCSLVLFGCYPGNVGTNTNPSDTTNKVTNEITQTVVDYNSNITIEDLEDSVENILKLMKEMANK